MIIGVIPSRWGSSRFPGKPLTPILGKPLVLWVVEAAKRAKRLDKVIVATDDQRIADAVSPHCQAVMTASDLPSGTDRVAVAAKAGPQDIVINIQGDEPLMDPALIDALADRMIRTGEEMATAACPIQSLDQLNARTVVKVVLRNDDSALYFSRLPIPCRRDGEPDLASGLYWRHLGIYRDHRIPRAAPRTLARRPHRRHPPQRRRRRRRHPRRRPDRRSPPPQKTLRKLGSLEA